MRLHAPVPARPSCSSAIMPGAQVPAAARRSSGCRPPTGSATSPGISASAGVCAALAPHSGCHLDRAGLFPPGHRLQPHARATRPRSRRSSDGTADTGQSQSAGRAQRRPASREIFMPYHAAIAAETRPAPGGRSQPTVLLCHAQLHARHGRDRRAPGTPASCST